MRKLITPIAVLFLLASCVSSKVVVNKSYNGLLPLDTLNLVSMMIGTVSQPIIPLIDAAAFNEKTNSISDQILNVQQKVIDRYQSILVNTLKENNNLSLITVETFKGESAEKYRV